ncbi:MAG: hypothetical protein AAF577_12425 [Pseudomonadota bacterium]
MSGQNTGDDDPFFIGFLPVPRALRGFLAIVSGVGLLAALGLGYVIAATQDDPGDGTFRFDLGRQSVTGVLVESAYPVLRITEGNERLPAGHSLLLSGPGKNGVQEDAAPHLGQLVTVEGVLLTRGDLDMMQVRRQGGQSVIIPADTPAPVLTDSEPLGRWRLTGELCDGKCYVGAMRPGNGIAHKACANLCVVGGVPMVMVSTAPVDGQNFFLVTGPDGGRVPQALLDATASIVALEGEIERIGDLLVFRADPTTLERL